MWCGVRRVGQVGYPQNINEPKARGQAKLDAIGFSVLWAKAQYVLRIIYMCDICIDIYMQILRTNIAYMVYGAGTV